MTATRGRPSGLTTFTVIWASQILSVLTTFMSQFARTVWAYEKTGSATALALVNVFFMVPFLIMTPVAGVMVDRYNRKLMMMMSDLGAGLATVALLALQLLGRLEIWHLYAAAAFTGLFQPFQWPAYSASISLMVPKEHYSRANGMMSLIEMGPGVFAPLLAGALLVFIHLEGILLLDVITFVIAISVLLMVSIPQPPKPEARPPGQGNAVREFLYGFQYILARPSLLGLQLVFLSCNLFLGLAMVVLPPMILARTGNNEGIFALVQSAGAIGGVVGGVVMSAWGGFKRRVNGVLLGWTLAGLLGVSFMGLGRTVAVWVAASFLGTLVGPLIDGSNQAIWQAKVAPEVQGRVFSVRMLIAWCAGPVTAFVAGPLSDFVLEPAMRPGGIWADRLGWLVGTGPGAGMSLLFVFSGILLVLIGMGGYFFPAVRNAERLLPDHDLKEKTAEIPV
jgi:MFS transporter, DHA3 family, macrolide efflux protein